LPLKQFSSLHCFLISKQLTALLLKLQRNHENEYDIRSHTVLPKQKTTAKKIIV